MHFLHCLTDPSPSWGKAQSTFECSHHSFSLIAVQMFSLLQNKIHNDLIDADSKTKRGQARSLPFCPLSGGSWYSGFLVTFEEAVLVFTGSLLPAMQVPLRFSFMPFYAKHLPSAWSSGCVKNLKLNFQICLSLVGFWGFFFPQQVGCEYAVGTGLISNRERFWIPVEAQLCSTTLFQKWSLQTKWEQFRFTFL